ncbi:MAG: cytochrome c biogenesis protein [Phycisphaerales bacterium]
MKTLKNILPWIVLLLSLAYAGHRLVMPDHINSTYDLDLLRQVPVSANGRTKPLDTVARNSLMNISGRQTLRDDGEKVSAIKWYIDLVTNPTGSENQHVFRIDHPEVLSLLGLDNEKRTRFSFAEIRPSFEEINKQAINASGIKAKKRDPFQRAILVLNQRLMLYSTLAQLNAPYLVAPISTADDWRSLIDALNADSSDPDAHAILDIYRAYQAKDVDAFNKLLRGYWDRLEQALPHETNKAGYEVVFNQAKPFISASVIFVFAFLFGCFGMLTNQMKDKSWSKTLLGSMSMMLVVAFIVQTLGIVSRVYLQGRPPVTNLYSSAVFIGWFSVIIGFIIERRMKNGLGGMMASVIGFGSLIIAHNLGSSGDTMEMMQAVLDSNFWLATHVVVVTIGYSATFFAGFLAIAYVLLGVFTPTLDRERGKSLISMVYGVICFATVTSFVGTVLGGIWADQSWGRFWGWDAKENGAALIVLWNLLILHARWGGMIKDRGIVVLAIFGNIITAWSWFGTNMLGVGLHSYGFTQSAVFWIAIFVLSQLALMGVGLVPLSMWRSKFQRIPNVEGA